MNGFPGSKRFRDFCKTGPGRKKNEVSTWIFDPRGTFHPGVKDRDEQISPWDRVNTERQMIRHRGETFLGMSSVM